MSEKESIFLHRTVEDFIGHSLYLGKGFISTNKSLELRIIILNTNEERVLGVTLHFAAVTRIEDEET